MSRFEEQSPEIFAFLNDMCAECHPPSARAMARNLLGEHRWSAERLRAFLASDGAFLSPAEIEDKLKKYQEKEVRTPIGSALGPAYGRPDNSNNSVRMPAGTELGTVIDLTRLGHVYAEAYREFGLPEFESFPDHDRSPSSINQFLKVRLESPGSRSTFMRALFMARRKYLGSKAHRVIFPTWTADWADLQRFLAPAAPERWLEAVGVARETGVWIAVIRYSADRGKLRLFRPTQLEAGWYPHHFPSPPVAHGGGGFTVFLDSATPATELVAEYIHSEVDFTCEDWESGGSLVGFTGRPVGGDLAGARANHLQLLVNKFGESVSEWMPCCL